MTIGYNIELKVLKPESPDFDKDNVYAVAPAEAETKADVPAWKGYFAAAVMLGSTETTFYTIAVYFSAAGITRTRYAVPAALCADLVGFLASAWAVGVVFG